MSSPLIRSLARALLCTVFLLLGAGLAGADGPNAIEELRARMEALEKQNQELLKTIKQPPAEAPKKEPTGGAGGAAPAREPGDWLEVGKQVDMRARWDNGMWYLETSDRAFRIHVGGRTQFDVVGLSADQQIQFGTGGVGPVTDGVNFRRARLEVDGTIYDTIDFWCEYDFLNTVNVNPPNRATAATVSNVPAPTDLWLTFTHLPWVGNIRVGNQKPPISLEHMTSSRFLNFLERSFAFDAFVELQDNGFRPGIQAFNWLWNERATWAIGLFAPERNVFGWNVGDGEFEVTGRMTGLPVYQNEGRCLIHLGLGASYVRPDEDIARYRARTLLRNGPPTLQPILSEANLFTKSGYVLVVPEFALIWGPLEIAAEFYGNWNFDAQFPLTDPGRTNRGTAFYHGGYVEALYFLTGEHRIYNRRAYENRRIASFDRVVPDENFFFVRREDGRLGLGSGAWQIGARYSYLDLQDKNIGLGIVHDITLGLNWFWNANSKFQLNYIYEWRDVAAPNTANGSIHGVGTRVAWDF